MKRSIVKYSIVAIGFVSFIIVIVNLFIQLQLLYSRLYKLEGSGFGPDSNESVTKKKVINPKDGQIIEVTETTTHSQSAKTLWDWLGLAGAIAIPFVLFSFQQAEQRRSEKQAETEKEIANNNLREQALEAYLDRMSELLIDKQLKVLIGKKLEESDPKYQKLDAALDIARARTLSVLRRLDKDGERKGSVIRFLVDAELISNLDLNGANLSSANLSSCNLSGADLGSADLRSADLKYANLRSADLRSADLSSADLSGVGLSGADLRSADLRSADLKYANLRSADLRSADLSGARNLTPEQVKQAKNWEKAKYSEEFRAKLGLPPEPVE